jgi:vacuolar-type H+-ATPase subunit I/STV1
MSNNGHKTLSIALPLFIAVGSHAPLAAMDNGLDEALKNCTVIENNQTRLACFDAATAKLKSNKALTVSSSDERAEALEKSKEKLEAEIETLRKQKEALAKAQRASKASFKIDYEGLTATVTKIQQLQHGRIRLYLNNNQVWDQVEAKRLRGMKVGTIVEFRDGALGGVSIGVEGKRRKSKFKRIR